VSKELSVEATGETVGEAKWKALRDLERLAPGLDRGSVRFQVVSEGERGLLGVGFTPALVVASTDSAAKPNASVPRPDESDEAAHIRGLVERVVAALGVRTRVEVDESNDELLVTCTGGELGLLIGKHGHTIDSLQYIANVITHRGGGEKRVTVDAAGYRDRRRSTLEAIAVRSAERAARGERVALDPMSAVERKIVHERLAEYPGVRTSSDGVEPNRCVVVEPDA
jgi:spoIIIJ-associated protein